ncbi:MAG TPA: restriction endonuclease [Thermoclostridium sp.]|nr:restriction endonuclease [Thermoclostridium sp.]
MLIIYAFLIAIAFIFYEVVSFIVHIIYLVKISSIVDSIDSKYDLLLLKLKDYEYTIAEAFRRQGYRVQLSDHFGDGGNGIILNDLYYVVVKKVSYHSLIEIEQAKKLIKHMMGNDIHRGMIITLGDFKTNTKNYCHTNVINCINGDQLLQMIKNVQTESIETIFSKYFQS